ncbi:MAG: hypothetical protein J6X66_02915 [Lachnospiraceae bacterium]|nr:hypothetical protein [Lachnospiraceae bacterium]
MKKYICIYLTLFAVLLLLFFTGGISEGIILNEFDDGVLWGKTVFLIYNLIISLVCLITADCLERAIEIRQECLNNLSPKPQYETCEAIELTGTKKERIEEAVRMAYTDVGEPEADFIKIKVSYSSSTVMFNEFGEISWFESDIFSK